MTELVVKELTKRFGDNLVVDNISFTVPSEKFVTILGPSGCGKTTKSTAGLVKGLNAVANLCFIGLRWGGLEPSSQHSLAFLWDTVRPVRNSGEGFVHATPPAEL